MQTYRTGNLKIVSVCKSADRICYVLYPLESLGEWIEEAAQKFDVTLVAISGMDWDDDLTPWPAPGEPPGSPDFRGRASRFLSTLIADVVPEVEHRLRISATAARTLCGVSLSGLFTLWQWMVCDAFRNIISLSGSFWYDGFTDWLTSQPMPRKTGRAYFLLGDREAHTSVRAFRPVQTNTGQIVAYLQAHHIATRFDLVPGTHYDHPLPRLNRALTWMYGTDS